VNNRRFVDQTSSRFSYRRNFADRNYAFMVYCGEDPSSRS